MVQLEDIAGLGVLPEIAVRMHIVIDKVDAGKDGIAGHVDIAGFVLEPVNSAVIGARNNLHIVAVYILFKLSCRHAATAFPGFSLIIFTFSGIRKVLFSLRTPRS